MISAAAKVAGLTVLHYDAEFERLAADLGIEISPVNDAQRAVAVGEVQNGTQGAAPETDETTDEATDTPEAQPEIGSQDRSDTQGDSSPIASQHGSSQNKTKARDLAGRASAAYGSGNIEQARKLFQQALEADRNNVDALLGLYDLHFDRAEYKDALTYGKRALALRPKRGSIAVSVGDACVKVLDYACARQHYNLA